MITRHHASGDIASTALYSPCECYRYALTRCWDPAGRRLTYVMLNPSKATEMDNDPTIARCERRARALGFGAFRVVNIFAWRETDPQLLRKVSTPIGPANDLCLRDATQWADMIIAAWGSHGAHLGRGRQVHTLLRDSGKRLHILGLCKSGEPRHPLYIGYAQEPLLWSDDALTNC